MLLSNQSNSKYSSNKIHNSHIQIIDFFVKFDDIKKLFLNESF
jgi:hypothetical protein